MKALILSGGKGTRLRPLTYTRAKQLIPVANKPTLFYGLESIAAAGVRDIGIIVGETRDEVMAAVGDGSHFGVQVTYIDQPEPRGLAHAVQTAQNFLGQEPFIMYLGDNILRDGVKPFVEAYHAKQPDALILLTQVDKPELFGNAVLNPDGSIRALEEKPRQPKSNLALVGVYLFTAKVHAAIARIKPSGRNELEITDAISQMITDGCRVESHRVAGWWKDTGNAEDLLSANRVVLERLQGHIQGQAEDAVKIEGPVSIGPGSIVRRTVLRGPLVIGQGCVIEDCFIGPFTSVDDKCLLSHCEIEHSIVMKHCQIKQVGQRIENSIFGEHSVVQGQMQLPRSHCFVVGDRSQISLSQS